MGSRAMLALVLGLALTGTGCVGSLMFGDDADAPGDDAATGDADTPGDDDPGDDDTGDDDDTADDDTGDDDDSEALECGPDPALDQIPPGTVVYTGYADVEVDASWENHWRWDGCQTAWVVVEPGELYCGVRWTLTGESDYEDFQNSGYGMLMDLEVDVDTCGEAEGGQQYLAVYEVQGSQWHAFDLYYYEQATGDWEVFAGNQPGAVEWSGQNSGSGWIEYRSIPFEVGDDEEEPPTP